MAQRRMFSKDIVRSDAFMDMPVSSQLLYFHLGMEADDDGFVDNGKTVSRMAGTAEDDMKILLSKRFLLSFNNGLLVIKHWKINNYIQSDRYKETKYIDEKGMIKTKENGAYTECIQDVYSLDTQVREGKVRKGKDKEEATKQNFIPIDIELSELLVEKITENMPTFKKPNIESWAGNIRLMRERDSRTVDQIKFVIEWCQKDDFWQANILSTSKLREKFDTLVAQIKRNATKEVKSRPNVIM
jgi:hypothetical protein